MLDGVPDVLALHHRRLLGPNGRPTRAGVDHLAVTASGVWVVDAKPHYGPLEVRRTGGILSPRVEQLFINGRDRTSLIEELQRNVTAVEAVLLGHPDVPVRGVVCFVGDELPWVTEEIAGIPLVVRTGLRTLLQAPGRVAYDTRVQAGAVLAARFVAA